MWVESFTNKDGIEQFRFIEKYKDPLTNKWRRTSVVMNKNNRQSEKEAMKRLDEKIAKKLRQDDSVTKTLKELTFNELALEWLEFYKISSGSKTSTLIAKTSKVNAVIKYMNVDILANNVNENVVQKFVNHLDNKKFHRKVVSDYFNIVKHILEYGEKKYDLDDISYLKHVVIPKRAYTHDEIKAKRENYLELSQINAIVEAVNNMGKNKRNLYQRFAYMICGYMIEFQALNGMRIGELLAIKEENIDFENKKLLIDGTILWVRKGTEYGFKDTTKTASSYRTISLTNRSIKILKQVMLERKKMIQWENNYQDRGFLFTDYKGNPISKSTINRVLQNGAKEIGIDKRVTTHTLRHSHISLLSQLGVSLKAIMERVGHTDHKTTLQIYSHVTEQMDKDMMSKLEAVGR